MPAPSRCSPHWRRCRSSSSPGRRDGPRAAWRGAFGEAVKQVYQWGGAAETAWDVRRWPLGLGALVSAVTTLFRYASRRRQPGLSWLAVGAEVTVLGLLIVSVVLGAYVSVADNFDDTYGRLTAVLAAQLEAVRGRIDPLLADTDGDGIPDELDR